VATLGDVKTRRTHIEHVLSALPLIATDARTSGIGRFVPTATFALQQIFLFNHLVGAGEQCGGIY